VHHRGKAATVRATSEDEAMKMEGRWSIIVWLAIAVVGISGIIEALPHASESVSDLAIDAAILAAVIGISALLARRFGTGRKAAK
jgi:hypothetical protein